MLVVMPEGGDAGVYSNRHGPHWQDVHLRGSGCSSPTPTTPARWWGDPDGDRDAWRRHDPTALVRSLAGTRAFVRRARTLGIPVHADLYAGGTHSWPYWQRELRRALPLLLGAIR